MAEKFVITIARGFGSGGKEIASAVAKELVEKAARADVNITTLTSCNMFLMNMNRRGPTRVKELTDAGVKVSIVSDDVCEVLRPFGNCDLVVLAAPTPEDVILDQPEKPYVLKNGKIVARSGKLIRKVEI